MNNYPREIYKAFQEFWDAIMKIEENFTDELFPKSFILHCQILKGKSLYKIKHKFKRY